MNVSNTYNFMLHREIKVFPLINVVYTKEISVGNVKSFMRSEK